LPHIPVAFHYPIRFIGRADGLPTGQVHATASDHRGKLWMATPNGLASFDGSRVTTFTQRDGLSTHGLRCVASDPDNGVWVGSDVGVDLVRLDGQIEALVGDWRWGLANDIAVGSDGTVWVASAQGLLHWDLTDGWIPESDARLADAPVHRVTADGAGRMWMSSRHLGVMVRSGATWQHPANDDWRQVGTVLCLSGGADGSVVIGGSDGAINIDASGNVVRRIAPLGVAVHAAYATRHELWLGTRNDMRCLTGDGQSWSHSATVFDSTRVNHITPDRHGNLWAATDSAGVVKIEAVRSAIERPDLPVGAVFAIRPNADGDLLVAGDQGCVIYHPATTATYQPIDALAAEKVWDLLEAHDGNIWAAAEAGLLKIDGDRVEHVGADHPVLAAPGRVLLDRGDGLWVGTLNGLAVVEPSGDIRTILADHDASIGYVYTLVSDGDTIWIGTLGNGLWRHRRAGLERLQGDGLLDTGNTYAIAIRDRGSVAVAQDNRIVVLADDRPPSLLATSAEALAGWAAAYDNNGSLWAGGSTGLCQYNARTGELRRRVTLWMGIDGSEFTTSRALLVDHDGHVWCGLNSGLAIIDPVALAHLASETPTVALASLMWTNALPKPGERGEWLVPQGRWTVEAKVYSTWPYHESSRLFRYRLLGFEPTWSEPTPNAQIQFSSLPPGGYTLEVQAHSPLAGWGPSASVCAFEVQRGPLRERMFGHQSAARSLRRLAGENHVLEQRVRDRMFELTAARDELESANQHLARLSLTDPLTNVANRRRFDTMLDSAVERSSRTDTALSLLIADVDEFKAFNDALGHLEGDRCLVQVAAAMTSVTRDGVDLLARYGGEEFAVLLPDTDCTTAMLIAERLREQVAELALFHPRSSVDNIVTVSVGVATTVSGQALTASDLIGAADRALYVAKKAGRNRCSAGTVARNESIDT
jgi:diguanylate cyclase (GGDEF)-like protein